MTLISNLVTAYAVLLFGVGVTFIFASVEIGAFIDDSASGQSLFAQLLGAAFIGFAAANGVARRSPLGGIYGRAVVLGTQTFSVVAALILLGNVPAESGFGFWLLLAVLLCGAALYGTLLFRGPQLRKSSDVPPAA